MIKVTTIYTMGIFKKGYYNYKILQKNKKNLLMSLKINSNLG
ncbi:MAG: hypothetical protein ACI8WT_001168 [Clostridium sp.]|jgi:hypothetical protein